MSKWVMVSAVLLLAACGQPRQDVGGDVSNANASAIVGGGILNVDESVTDVETYLRGLPASEQIAPGIVQHVRRATGTSAVEADLIDGQSGSTVGLATYDLADVNGRTRVTLRLTQMSGAYASASRQGVLADQILGYLRRDLGDV